jgi:ubiquinone/menaquinone biosynthesis C-methylase UbiE
MNNNGFGAHDHLHAQSKVVRRKPMDTKEVYSTKAEKYAKYRWDYAPQAIEAIVEITRMNSESTLADLGAGTGILTRHFAGRVHRVYAIEPNAEQRQILARELQAFLSVRVLNASAEDTMLPKSSVDVITVAQAIHWFDPEPARREMLRVLKRGGWLALVRNYGTNEEKSEALGSLVKEEYGADFTVVTERPRKVPNRFYFGDEHSQKLTFPFRSSQNWEQFIGSLTTASYMPDEAHPLCGKLEAKAREVFSRYSADGSWIVEGETELIIGQPSL